MTDTNTIRLSDRLELTRSGNDGLPYGLCLDGLLAFFLKQATGDALIEACNPSRLILPPGVIHGSDGKFYAPGAVLQGLPPKMWQRLDAGIWCIEHRNAFPAIVYQVRPTTTNPSPTLPDTCWQIPDGRICCLRKDAAALRDMGWTISRTGNGGLLPEFDADCPHQVVEARPPAKPDTEKVPLHELPGRNLPGCDWPVTQYALHTNGVYEAIQNDQGGFIAVTSDPARKSTFTLDADGKVEVLAR